MLPVMRKRVYNLKIKLRNYDYISNCYNDTCNFILLLYKYYMYRKTINCQHRVIDRFSHIPFTKYSGHKVFWQIVNFDMEMK